MKNIKIERTNTGSWVVKADTERFGINQIMFEGINQNECWAYIEREAVKRNNALVIAAASKKVVKSLTYKGMSVKELEDGTFRVAKDKFVQIVDDFNDAGSWVYEMADNNDIGRELNHRMCKKWGIDFEGNILKGHLSDEDCLLDW